MSDRLRSRVAGFTLVELLVTCAVLAVLSAAGMPVLAGAIERYRIGMSIRDVERELQSARLKAVSSNQPIRVRFNCPDPGFYRVVELVGEASAPAPEDATRDRCRTTLYPYPPADHDPLTRPNHDGPLRQLSLNVVFGSSETLEFWPDGSVHTGGVAGAAAAPWPVVAPTGVVISVRKGAQTKSVSVNGIGRVAILR